MRNKNRARLFFKYGKDFTVEVLEKANKRNQTLVAKLCIACYDFLKIQSINNSL
jgi:hypothetical protein